MAHADLALIRRHAERAFPEECCGVLVGHRIGGDSTTDRVVRAENIADTDRTRSYQIDWKTLLDVQRETRRRGEEIIGFYHSHPDGTGSPSRKDRDTAWIGYSYLIVPLIDGSCGRAASWRVDEPSATFVRESLGLA